MKSIYSKEYKEWRKKIEKEGLSLKEAIKKYPRYDQIITLYHGVPKMTYTIISANTEMTTATGKITGKIFITT